MKDLPFANIGTNIKKEIDDLLYCILFIIKQTLNIYEDYQNQ